MRCGCVPLRNTTDLYSCRDCGGLFKLLSNWAIYNIVVHSGCR